MPHRVVVLDRAHGRGPHYHRHHADSFYVLEGEMAFLIHDEEHMLGPGDCVCAPPGVVHGFRSLSSAHWLNMHTPNSGFCEHLQSLDGGGPGGFDNVDVEPGESVGPVEEAILLKAGEGERLETDHRVATIKIGREELSLIEFELKPSFEGPGVHDHDDHTDAFFVLDGEVGFTVDGESFVAVGGTLRRRDAGRLPHVHERPRRRPPPQHPCTEHGLPRPPARDELEGAPTLRSRKEGVAGTAEPGTHVPPVTNSKHPPAGAARLCPPPAGPSKGAPVIARMATYRASGNPNDLARRAEEGILPLFKEQHGFRSYSVAIDGNDVLSLSVWDTRADAEAGSELAADFVRTNMAGELELTEKRFAEVAFSTTLGVSTMAAATA